MTWSFNCHHSYFHHNLSKSLLWGNVANFAAGLCKKKKKEKHIWNDTLYNLRMNTRKTVNE